MQLVSLWGHLAQILFALASVTYDFHSEIVLSQAIAILVCFDSRPAEAVAAGASFHPRRFSELIVFPPWWPSRSRSLGSSLAAEASADWARIRGSFPARWQGTRRNSHSQMTAWRARAAGRSRWGPQSTRFCSLRGGAYADEPICCRGFQPCGFCLLTSEAPAS